VASVTLELLLGIAWLLPFRIFRFLAILVMRFYRRVFGRKLVANARESLGIAFGSSLSDADKSRIARVSFDTLVEGMLGIFCAVARPKRAEKFFSVEGQEHLDKALGRGKGAAIAIAHLGPFSWMIFRFVDLGYSVNVVMRPPRDNGLYEKLLTSKKRCGINLIYSVPVRSCVVESRKALERGELVFMPVDQNFGGQGRLFVDFFGRPAATAPGPVAFALKTGTPLFFIYALPDGWLRWRIIIAPEIPLEKAGTEREALLRNTAALAKRLEGLVRQYPEQWSWMHRRWKAVPRAGEI
jgi:KDO2-lipid IV(A) lauroyltransferase